MPENQSFGTSSSIQDYRKSVNSRLTPSTIESKDPFVMEKPSQAELKQGPKIVGVADDRTAPQKLLRGLTVLWRKFTSNSIGPSSNFEGSAVEYTSDGSAPGHWYISAENQHDSLDIVVEDNKFAMDDTVDPSETSHHSTGGRNQYTHSQGHASAHASDLGPLSSVPSYLSYLSRIKVRTPLHCGWQPPSPNAISFSSGAFSISSCPDLKMLTRSAFSNKSGGPNANVWPLHFHFTL